MRKVADLSADCLVVGQGAAGLLCGMVLASKGRKVAVVGRGTPSTVLSTGCITLRNRSWAVADDGPTDLNALLMETSTLRQLIRDGDFELGAVMAELREFLVPRLSSQGLPMTGHFNSTQLMLSNNGTPYACSVAQRYTSAGRLRGLRGMRVAVLGVLGLAGFDPDLLCAIASSIDDDFNPRAYWMQLPGLRPGRDVAPSEIADLAGRTEVEAHIASAVGDLNEDAVGLPPLFGLEHYIEKMRFIEHETGKTIFEPATPLSLPGRRLQEALEAAAVAEGCRLMKGLRMSELHLSGGRATSGVARSRSREQCIEFSDIVLATGDLVGGGLAVHGDTVRESTSTFLVSGAPDSRAGPPGGYPGGDRLREISRFGVKIGSGSRPYSEGGEIVSNARAAGSVISGLSFSSGIGLGGVLLSAWLAARAVLEGDA